MPNALWLILGAALCIAHAWLFTDLGSAFAGLCLMIVAFCEAHPHPPSDESEYVPQRDRLGL